MAQTSSYPRVEFVIQPSPFIVLYGEDLLTAKPYRDPVTGILGAPRFGCQAIIPNDHPQLADLKSTVLKVWADAFGGDAGKLPLKSGDKINAERVAGGKKPYDIYAGAMVLYCKSNEKTADGRVLMPPRLVVLQGGKMVDYQNEQRQLAAPFFYSGVKACGAFKFQAYAGMGRGVTCYVERVMSFNTGDRLAIGKSSEDVFGSVDSYAEYVGRVTAESVVPQAAAGTASPW